MSKDKTTINTEDKSLNNSVSNSNQSTSSQAQSQRDYENLINKSLDEQITDVSISRADITNPNLHYGIEEEAEKIDDFTPEATKKESKLLSDVEKPLTETTERQSIDQNQKPIDELQTKEVVGNNIPQTPSELASPNTPKGTDTPSIINEDETTPENTTGNNDDPNEETGTPSGTTSGEETFNPDLVTTGNSVDENTAEGTVIATLDLEDAAGSVFIYFISDENGIPVSNSNFKIVGNELVVSGTANLDFESLTSHNIHITAIDGGGNRVTEPFAININDVDEFDVSPITDTDTTANSINENASIGTSVGITAFASDEDGTNNGITYSLSDDTGGLFAIDPNTGEVTVAGAIDYETATSQTIEVTATSEDGSTSTQNFTININDVDEFDVSAITDTDNTTNSVAENSSVGTSVGITAFASDADGSNNGITYSLSDDAGGLFAIDPNTGEVTVAGSIDYETATSQTIEVTATSDDGSTSTQSFTINITDVDEFDVSAITDTGATTNSVAENSAVGTSVGITAFASDADGSNNGVTYSLSDDAGGLFAIDPNTGEVTVAGAINYETATSQTIEVTATSDDGSTSTQSFTINVTDVDEFDVSAITDTNADANAVDEDASVGTTVGITALATDADGSNNSVTYSLSDDAGGLFTIDANTGVVTVASGLDAETATSHNITVVATSSDGSTSNETFTINVNDVSETSISAITDNDGSANSVSEGASVGTAVGITALATDADVTDTVTYSLSSNPGGFFAIDANTGVVTVASSLDFEANEDHTIEVTATSTDGTTSTETFTIDVTDVDEFDVSAITDTDATTNSVAENSAIGTSVGITAFASDADGSNNGITYSLSDDTGGLFAIDPNTGEVTVAGAINYETATSQTIEVTATSTDGSTSTETFTIDVTDVNEAPTGSGYSYNEVSESSSDTDVLTTVVVNDPDAGDTLSYQIVGGSSLFEVNNNGEVTLKSGQQLDFETAETHDFVVRATDSSGNTFDTATTIDISDVNEFGVSAITDTDSIANSVAENATVGTSVGITAFASDADGSNNGVTYSLSDDAGGLFAIDPNTGEVTVAGAIDYETATSQTIEVTATSEDGSTSTQSFTININDVDEFDVSPITDTNAGANTVAEHAAIGTFVGITALATDGDITDTVTYSLSDDANGAYTIDPNTGEVTVADPSKINYESGTTQTIEVTATSTDGSTSTQSYTINVTDTAEHLVLTDGNDVFVDTGVTELSIDGGAGADHITGTANNDEIHGGDGYDTLIGDDGDDLIYGGRGFDNISGGAGNDRIFGDNGIDILDGGDGDDYLDGGVWDDTLIGGAGNDTLIGGLGMDDLSGGSGDDHLDGGNYDDTLDGGTGDDTMLGGAGSDTIHAGQGNDEIDGGLHIDTLVLTGVWADYTITENAGVYTIVDNRPGSPDGTDTVQNVENFQFADATVPVADILNDTPTDITVTGGTIAENVSDGTVVATLGAVDADSGIPSETASYSLTNDPSGNFEIVGNEIRVKAGSSLDFEANTSHNVTVQVTDVHGATYSEVITINVTDHDEFDIGAISDSDAGANTVAENAAIGTSVGITAFAQDQDGSDDVTYSLSNDAGGLFAIDPNTGEVTVAGAIDYETAISQTIEVTATSEDGSTSTQSFTININDVDEFDVSAITDTDATTNSVAENSAVGTSVGITAFASDADGSNNGVTYSLSDDAGGLFAIDPNTGEVTVAGAIDYEAATSQTIEVTATSDDGSTSTQSFTINVTDVDEFDVSAITDTNADANAVDEDASVGTTVGITALATDADGSNNSVTYSLSDDAGGLFTIDANTGVVTVASGLDAETATSHNITVVATSSDGSTSNETFTINVNDVSETSISAITDNDGSANSVSEGASVGTAVGITALATDADVTDTVTYSLSSNPGGFFAIDANTGVVTVASSLDFEANEDHTIEVTATSTDGTTSTETFTIDVTDVDEFDVSAITDTDATTNSVAENSAIGTSVGITAFASDADGSNNGVTYSLSDDAGGLFAIDPNTGEVTVAGAIDYETATSQTIKVTATSEDGSTSTQSFTINVTDVDEFDVSAITDTNTDANAADEDASVGSIVGITALATDADGSNNSVTYSLSDDAGGLFTIDANTGVVTVASGLDAETATSHNITVVATSSDGSTSNETFTINVNDVSETSISAITDNDGSANSVSEGASVGTAVGITALATDADVTDTVTYSLSSNPGGFFAIDANTGVVTVASSLDFEANEDHTIEVTATSTDGTTSTETFTIDVTDVDEFDVSAITDTDATTNSVAENSAIGTSVGITAFASDADGSNNGVTYSLSDDAGGLFAIDPNTGEVTVAGAIDYETATSQTIKVTATSEDGSTSTQSFTINVTDVDEFDVSAITDTNTDANAADEDASVGSIVGITALATDADGSNNSVTYSLSDDAGGLFTIDANTGVVTVASGLDAETATSHNITVVATSSDGSTSNETFTINVNDVSETSISAITDNDGSANSVSEGASVGTAVGITALATDADVTDTVTYSLSSNPGGFFAIDANTGVVTVASSLDFEANEDHTIEVTATSTDGTTSTETFTIDVTDVDEFDVSAITDTDATTNSVAENSAIGTSVGITAFASDDDGSNNGVTYSLSDDAGGLFAIDPNTGEVTVAGNIDYETATSQTIEVTATSDDGSTSTQNFTININDVNEFDNAPTDLTFNNTNIVSNGDFEWGPTNWSSDSSTITTSSQNAYGVAGSTGQVLQLDRSQVVDNIYQNITTVEGQQYTLSIDVAARNIQGGYHSNTVEIYWNGELVDIAEPTSGWFETFTFQVTGTGGDDRLEFREEASDNNSKGAILDNIKLEASLSEGAENGDLAAMVTSVIDADVGDTHTFSLVDDANGAFTIEAGTGRILVADASKLDYETAETMTVTVRVTDAGGNTYDEDLTIDITNTNDYDVTPITDTDLSNGDSNTVSENAGNGTTVGITAFAADADSGDTVTYSLSDDANGAFKINAATGVVKVKDPSKLDHESSTTQTITVKATSSDGSEATRSFTITINDDNSEHTISAISDTNAGANTVTENATIGTAVGITAFASDADGTDDVTYSLSNNASGLFAIDPNTGEVTVAGNIDYETATSQTIEVTATSTDGTTSTETFTIDVTDVDEFDVSAITDTDATTNSVAENSAIGTSVGITAFASDADGSNNGITYSLSDDAGGLFAIDPNTGEVTVAGAINYETATSQTIEVTATSTDGSTSTETFTIDVTDVNEAPTGSGYSYNEVSESSSDTDVLTTVVVNDPDAGDTLSYQIVGGSSLFEVNNNGEVTLKSGQQLDFETAETHDFVVRATDSSGNTFDTATTIDISDVNEFGVSAITDTDGIANSVAENATVGTSVGITAFASDADGSNNGVTYSLSDDAGGLFAINPNTGEVTVAGNIDYETATSYTIEVTATSDDGSTSTQNFTINVTDVDEFDISTISDSDAGANAVNENASIGTSVDITAFATDADTTDTVTYSLSNDAGGLFTIDASTGEVTVAGTIDYETAASHTIQVTATSSDGSTSTENFTIDVNAAPTDIDLTASVSNGSLISNGDFSNGSNGWTLNNPSGGAAPIVTAGGTLQFNFGDENVYGDSVQQDFSSEPGVPLTVSLDLYENNGGVADHTARIDILDTDGNVIATETILVENNTNETTTFTFTPTTENSTIVITNTDSTNSITTDLKVDNISIVKATSDLQVAENFEGVVIGTLTTTDPDQSDPHSYSVSDARFEVVDDGNGNMQLKLKDDQSLDYETDSSVTVTVTTTDSDGLSFDKDFTINVNDVNEAPTDITVTGNKDLTSNSDPNSSNALSFDGSNNGTMKTTISEIGNNAGDLTTISFWMNWDSSNIDNMPISFGNNYDLWITEDNIGFNTWNQNLYGVNNASATLGDGWHHITVVVESNAASPDNMHIYIDGVDQNLSHQKASNWAPRAVSDTLEFGGQNDLYDFSGNIADVQVYNRELTSSEVESVYNGETQSDLVGHYTFEGSTITQALADQSGNGNDGFADGTLSTNDLVDGPSAGIISAGSVVANVTSVVDEDSGDTHTFTLTDDANGIFTIDTNSGDISLFANHDTSSALNDTVTVQVTDSSDNTYTETIGINLGSKNDETITGTSGTDIMYGNDGNDQLNGGGGNDILNGGAGNDTLTGGDGSDLFIFQEGDGNDTIDGGAGGGWTDTIQLQDELGGSDLGVYGTDWTVTLTEGTIEETNADNLLFSEDADGTITLEDGSSIDFTDIERIDW